MVTLGNFRWYLGEKNPKIPMIQGDYGRFRVTETPRFPEAWCGDGVYASVL